MLTLLFYSGEHCFGIDGDEVVEVIPQVKLQPIPNAPPYVAGSVNVGGHLFPVIDLCQLVEKRGANRALHTRLILLQNRALLAEKVMELEELDQAQFDATASFQGLPFISGCYKGKERTIYRLDVPALVHAIPLSC